MSIVPVSGGELTSQLDNAIGVYFKGRGGERKICVQCNREYITFQKDDFCGSSKCKTPLAFTEKINSKPERITHLALGERFRDFFSRQGKVAVSKDKNNNKTTKQFIFSFIQ